MGDDDRYKPLGGDRGRGRARRFDGAPTREESQRTLMKAVARLDKADGLLDLAHLGDQGIQLRKWVVPDLIPAANVTQLSGDGGLGKSLLALQLLVAVALGLEWLGVPVRQGRALGIFCEDDEPELHRRLYEICNAYNVTMADLDENLVIVTRVGLDNALMTYSRFGEDPPEKTPFYNKIYAHVVAEGPSVVVLDSSHDLYIGNENDRTQVRQFVGALRTLAMEGDAGVLLNSHPSLTGMNSGSGSSGSTAWNNAVRSRLYLTVPDASMDKKFRTLKTMKSNYTLSGAELSLVWENGIFVPSDQLGTTQSSLKKLQTGEAMELVLDAIRDMCERGLYPSPHNNHPKLYVVKLLRTVPLLHGMEAQNLENLVQQGIRQKQLESIAVPRSRTGKYRPAIVPMGFRPPRQADIVFTGDAAKPQDDEPEDHNDRIAREAPDTEPAAHDTPPVEAYEDDAGRDSD